MSGPTIQLHLRREEKELAVAERAVAACLADIMRRSPGTSPLPNRVGEGADRVRFQERVDIMTSRIQMAEQSNAEVREWMGRLPVGAERARELALGRVFGDDVMEGFERDRKRCAEDVKRLEESIS